jgi:hypothetical protein
MNETLASTNPVAAHDGCGKRRNGASGERQPAKGRSAVTNGGRLHVDPPKGLETRWARRFRDVLAEIVSDLGGHDSGLSEAQRQLARRGTTIAITCEKMEGEAAGGNDIDLEMYGRLTDRLGRGFQRLGIKRLQRDVTPLTVESYYAAQREREVAEKATAEAAAVVVGAKP